MSDTPDPERGFTLVRTLDATPDRVFEAWTDPDHLNWFFNPTAPTPSEPIELDLRVGGAWRQKMVINDELEYVTGGIYLEIVPGEKLVFMFGATDGWPKIDPDHPEDTPIVTILLSAVHDKTEMILQVALPAHLSDEQVREWLDTGMRAGWGDTIDRLVDRFAGVDVRG
jgi:uncharacterized protein YndB with AHSA1/START domain